MIRFGRDGDVARRRSGIGVGAVVVAAATSTAAVGCSR